MNRTSKGFQTCIAAAALVAGSPLVQAADSCTGIDVLVTQTAEGGQQRAILEVTWGRLCLRTLSLGLVEGVTPQSVVVRLGDRSVEATLKIEARRAVVTFSSDVICVPKKVLEITLS